MDKSQHSTGVLVTDLEAEKGYFTFTTTRLSHFKRVCKQIGGEGEALDIYRMMDGRKVVLWSIKIPIECLPKKTTWGIAKKGRGRGGNPKGNPEALRLWRAAKRAKTNQERE